MSIVCPLVPLPFPFAFSLLLLLVTIAPDEYGASLGEPPLQDPLRHDILHLALDDSLQRPRPVLRVIARRRQPLPRGLVQHELDLPPAAAQSLVHLGQLQVHDGKQLRRSEGVEDHKLFRHINE